MKYHGRDSLAQLIPRGDHYGHASSVVPSSGHRQTVAPSLSMISARMDLRTASPAAEILEDMTVK